MECGAKMNFTKREVVLLIILMMSIIYACYEYIYKPAGEKTAALAEENDKLEHYIEVQEGLLNKRTENTNSDLQRERYQQLWWRIPEDPCLPEIIECLSKASRESGVKIVKLSCKNAGAAGSYLNNAELQETIRKWDCDVLFIDVEVNGSYDALLSFVLMLENAGRLFRLNSLIIEPAVKAGAGDGSQTNRVPARANNAKEKDPNKAEPETGHEQGQNDEYDIDGAAENDDIGLISLKLNFMAFYDRKTTSD